MPSEIASANIDICKFIASLTAFADPL
ncbi:MAG: hypothetical protein YK1309IOTA_250021, partial [Marine Group I thaumarchaeote]